MRYFVCICSIECRPATTAPERQEERGRVYIIQLVCAVLMSVDQWDIEYGGGVQNAESELCNGHLIISHEYCAPGIMLEYKNRPVCSLPFGSTSP